MVTKSNAALVVAACLGALLVHGFPVFPPQAMASLVGTCYAFDAFNCPEMYVGRSFTSQAYFDYTGQRLREDDVLSIVPDDAGVVNFERVYGYNLNATHMEITLLYALSNVTVMQCVRSIYAGQTNRQTFLENATLVDGNATIRGDTPCELWLVTALPAYNQVYFYTAPLVGTNFSRIHRIESSAGAFVVDYFNFRSITVPDAVLTPPANRTVCPLV